MARWAKAGEDDEKFIWDAGADYFKVCSAPVPTAGEPWNERDTDKWQSIGWWRGMTTLLLYARTGNEVYARNAIELMMAICKSAHWEISDEEDYGMGTGQLMATVALIYDTTYDQLTDAQRKIVRQRLWLAADRMYNYGFNDFKKIPNASVRYWQQDPQNNHRWHRLCGYMLACLAIYGEEPGIDGYLDHAIKEAQFVEKWLPDDGSNHEGVGYQAFGMQFLVPAFVAMDRCLIGMDGIRKDPGFHEAPYFRAHMITPDGQHMWNFGDGDWGTYYFSHDNFKLASEWRDPMAQALHLRNFELSPESYIYHGWTLLWYDPTLKPGDLAKLPTWRYFPDLDIAAFRQAYRPERPGGLSQVRQLWRDGTEQVRRVVHAGALRQRRARLPGRQRLPLRLARAHLRHQCRWQADAGIQYDPGQRQGPGRRRGGLHAADPEHGPAGPHRAVLRRARLRHGPRRGGRVLSGPLEIQPDLPLRGRRLPRRGRRR